MQGSLDLILALKELVLPLIHFESAQLLSRFGFGGDGVREEDQLAEFLVPKASQPLEEESCTQKQLCYKSGRSNSSNRNSNSIQM